MCPAPWNSDPLPAHHMEQGVAFSSANRANMPSVGQTMPMRSHPLSHLPVDAPICLECQALDLTFFDPSCAGCRASLLAQEATVAHVFAALRQWVPQVQARVDFLVEEALRRGAHPDDRDCLTDMTLLMYSCKAGAGGVGDADTAAQVAEKLVCLGADLTLRCKWTNMIALHYAAYFDVGPVVEKLLMKSKGVDVDTPCSEYEDGTALHIAASNLSTEAAKVLLAFGADPEVRDALARTPADCVPDPEEFAAIPDSDKLVSKMEKILSGKSPVDVGGTDDGEGESVDPVGPSNGAAAVSGRTVLRALGLQVGDRVLVNGGGEGGDGQQQQQQQQQQHRLGTLRFCGTTEFAAGVWAGVALDRPEGRNDGAVKGVFYFRCKDGHGVFVPAGKVAKVGRNYREEIKPAPRLNVVNHGKVDTSHVSSRLTECLEVNRERQEIRVGDRVQVEDILDSSNAKASGSVRFIGEVDFDHGDHRWFGIELDHPIGRHDGTVQGVRYFAAADNRGVFVTESKVTKMSNSNNGNSESATAPPAPALAEVRRTPASSRPASATVRRSETMRSSRQQLRLQNTCRVDSTPTSRPASAASQFSTSTTQRGASLSTPAQQQKEEGWKTVSAQQFNKFQKKVPKKYLEVGTGVICVHTKEMGVVKFVGRVDFAPGIWVGLELRDPREGRHDGEVKGRRYFSCRPSHGVVLRPRMISVHGINGEKLLRPDSEYPF